MRYLCLYHHPDGSAVADDLSSAESYVLAAGALEPAGRMLVRPHDAFVELPAAPPLIGFALLEARDLNEAIQLAARLPSTPRVLIEICPLRSTLRVQ